MARIDEGEVAGARRGTRDPAWSREGPRARRTPQPSLSSAYRRSVESPALSLRTFTVNTPLSVCALMV